MGNSLSPGRWNRYVNRKSVQCLFDQGKISMTHFSVKAVVENLQRSIIRSGTTYAKAVPWRYPTDAPEYIYTAGAFHSLRKQFPSYTFQCEGNARENIEKAGGKRRGRYPKHTRGYSRNDITIFKPVKGSPVGLIEIKSFVFSRARIESDVERLISAVGGTGGIHFGVVAFTTFADSNREKRGQIFIEERTDRWSDGWNLKGDVRISSLWKRGGFYTSDSENGRIWGAGCIVISGSAT